MNIKFELWWNESNEFWMMILVLFFKFIWMITNELDDQCVMYIYIYCILYITYYVYSSIYRNIVYYTLYIVYHILSRKWGTYVCMNVCTYI